MCAIITLFVVRLEVYDTVSAPWDQITRERRLRRLKPCLHLKRGSGSGSSGGIYPRSVQDTGVNTRVCLLSSILV